RATSPPTRRTRWSGSGSRPRGPTGSPTGDSPATSGSVPLGPDVGLGVALDERVGDGVHHPPEGGEVVSAGQVDQVVAHAVNVHRRGRDQEVVAPVGEGADDAAAVLRGG